MLKEQTQKIRLVSNMIMSKTVMANLQRGQETKGLLSKHKGKTSPPPHPKTPCRGRGQRSVGRALASSSPAPLTRGRFADQAMQPCRIGMPHCPSGIQMSLQVCSGAPTLDSRWARTASAPSIWHGVPCSTHLHLGQVTGHCRWERWLQLFPAAPAHTYWVTEAPGEGSRAEA